MRIRTLIVDDEFIGRETLSSLINEYCPGIEIIGEATDISSARELILSKKPDLLLLDVNMPGGNGFELLKSLDNIPFELVFVTAYDQFALQAIKSCALDYILKPVNIQDLQIAMEKVKQKLSQKVSESNIKFFLDNYSNQSGSGKIAIPRANGLTFISITEIIKLRADGNYTHISLSSGKDLISTRNLKEYEDMLPSSQFLRIHNSYIINLESVIEYQKGEGGMVTLTDKSQIVVSRRRKKYLLDKFSRG